MKILICGGRHYDDIKRAFSCLDYALTRRPIDHVIHGGARGADTLAGRWAKHRNIPCTVYPADWHRYGNQAGYRRNRQMLEEGKPDGVIAFPGGPGTANMIKLAQEAGIRVWQPLVEANA